MNSPRNNVKKMNWSSAPLTITKSTTHDEVVTIREIAICMFEKMTARLVKELKADV